MPTPTKNSPPGRIPDDSTDDDVPADVQAAKPLGQAAAQGREDAARVRADSADELRCPEGAALFENTTDQPVRITLRDEGNRPHRIECEPRGKCLAPAEYADVVSKRAPQLKFIAARARRHVSED